jgi:DNA ligase 1
MNIGKFPTLYKKDSKGNLQMWEIEVDYERAVDSEMNPIHYGRIKVRHGRLNGKIQTTIDIISEGKNIGKANETTPYTQTLAEAKAKWIKQQERKGYVLSPEATLKDERAGAEPMLAHRFDKFPNKIQYPAFIQKKYNGHRIIAVVENGTAKLYSRRRTPITGLPHIEKALVDLMGYNHKRKVFDGEGYFFDGTDKFEEVTGYIRSQEPKEGYEKVQYYIYDLVENYVPYLDRLCTLQQHLMFAESGSPLRLAPTFEVKDEDEALTYFQGFLKEGMEGAMLRNMYGLYEGKRSYNLLKLKTFLDSEFPIIGVEEGRGKLAGHAIFICSADNVSGVMSSEFRVKLKGPTEQLKKYFEDESTWKGKLLTVQYQTLSAYGKPIFPVGVRIYEEV